MVISRLRKDRLQPLIDDQSSVEAKNCTSCTRDYPEDDLCSMMLSDLFIFFQNVNTSLLQVAMLGKNLSHLTSGGGEDGESGCFSSFSLLLSQSQTFS